MSRPAKRKKQAKDMQQQMTKSTVCCAIPSLVIVAYDMHELGLHAENTSAKRSGRTD